ncbi:hypothetical protein QR685DRAFT_121821 [Neurospora intermedia]|uniref:Transmembrane protein n=1 Tax=Neurospora intermedia TaxID=5142 RepID=A0ABR3D1H3_NEUIN
MAGQTLAVKEGTVAAARQYRMTLCFSGPAKNTRRKELNITHLQYLFASVGFFPPIRTDVLVYGLLRHSHFGIFLPFPSTLSPFTALFFTFLFLPFTTLPPFRLSIWQPRACRTANNSTFFAQRRLQPRSCSFLAPVVCATWSTPTFGTGS